MSEKGVHDAYYFGCWKFAGHHLFGPHRDWVGVNPFKERSKLAGVWLDPGFCPGLSRWPDGRTRVPDEQPQGLAALHHVEDNGPWTVLAFWDRTVDQRAGSHSTFIVRGTHSFEEVVRISKEVFGAIWDRFDFEVRLA